MEDKICIYICNSLVPEVSDLLHNGNYPDVTLKSFPAVCIGSKMSNDRIMALVANDIDHFSKTIIFLSACRGNKNIDHPSNKKIEIIQLEQCFELFFNPQTIYHFIKQGNYLVSNGWLNNYQHHIREWRFDNDSAKKFFGESIKKILLLETGLPGNYQPNLEALSNYMGLPFEILPIGNSHLQKYIETIILNWRNENERKELNERIADSTRESADNALMFYHLQKLIEHTNEDVIIQEILKLSDLLFAPKQIVYQQIESTKTNVHFLKSNQTHLNFNANNSLEVEVDFANEPLGVLGISGIKFPEYIPKYQNMTEIICQMAGLAISNARRYAELKRTKLAIIDSEQQFHSLFDNMNEGVALHKLEYHDGNPFDYRIVNTNERFAQILGIQRDDVIGKLSTVAYNSKTPPYFKDYLDVVQNNKPIFFETYFPSMDKYFAISAVPWQHAGFATIFTDITERKKSELNLRKLSQAVEQSPVSIVITDVNGNIEYGNPVISKITGYAIEEIVGKNPRIFSSGEISNEEYKNLWYTINSGNKWQGEFHNKKKNGEFYWESALISPIKNKEGQIIHFLAIKEDITDRKESENKIAENNQKFKNLSQSATDMLGLQSADDIYEYITDSLHKQYPNNVILFVTIDEDKHITTLVNLKGISKTLIEKVKKLSGFNIINYKYKLESSHLQLFKLGSFYHFKKGLAEFSGPEFPKLAAKAIEKLLGIRGIYTIGINKGNKLFATIHFFNKSNQPITDNEYIESFVKQAGIVIERKQAEEQLQKNEIELRETIATKDKFFSIISHDLRSPFAAIVGLLSIMAEHNNNFTREELIQFSQSAYTTSQSIYHLLENLLEWSRMQRGVIPFNAEPIHLNEFEKTCDPTTLELANAKEIKIEFEFTKGLTINADNDMLHSIMRNLVTNAIKFTDQNGLIQIKAKEYQNNSIIISITDNGIGMDKDRLAKLFNIGFNISRPGTNNEPSSGLGLILCKEFVEKHGGKIWAESEEGKGSTFYFTLLRNYK